MVRPPYAAVHRKRSENNLKELFLSLYRVGPRDLT